MLLH
ncbi:hypothetical protein F383_06822 [Gossypium arboreum]|jgi:hypothetical protein